VELAASQASEDYFTFNDESSIEIMQTTVSVGNLTVNVPLYKSMRHTLLIPSNLGDTWRVLNDTTSKPEQGSNTYRFVNGMTQPVDVTLQGGTGGTLPPLAWSTYTRTEYGKSIFTIANGEQSCDYTREFGFGSSYTFLIPSTFTFEPNCESIRAIEEIQPNKVHMAFQIPQYFLITAGEVVFSVTGLEFSYSQAPSNMKSVLQAGWLFTVAVGNFIVLIVAEGLKDLLPEQWAEYILFASLLVVVCIIFSIMAYFYTYNDPASIEEEFNKKDEDDEDKPKREEIEMVKKDSTEHHKDNEGKQTKM